MSEESNKLGVYGYAVMYRLQPGGRWMVDQDDEYRTLPAHYRSLDEALDRVGFMRLKKVEARVAAIPNRRGRSGGCSCRRPRPLR